MFANGLDISFLLIFNSFQLIDVIIDLVMSHNGFFVFALCPNNDHNKDPDQVFLHQLRWQDLNPQPRDDEESVLPLCCCQWPGCLKKTT
jgi:hypothetical protein